MQPHLVELGVEAGDPEGLPDPTLMELMQGGSLLRTDQNRWIGLITDEEQMQVEKR